MDIFTFKKTVDGGFHEHLIYLKVEKIEQEIQSGKIPNDLEAQLNSIDKQVTRITLAAEKKCASSHHESEWSIELHQHSILCKYWTIVNKGEKSAYKTSFRAAQLYRLLMEHQALQIKNALNDETETNFGHIVTKELKRSTEYN
jgi:hypothetical protein